MCQCYMNANLVEIRQAVRKIWCTQALFDSPSPTVTLRIRSRSTPTKLFIMPRCYIRANLVKIHLVTMLLHQPGPQLKLPS